MNKFLSRIFAGLLAVLIALALVCAAVFSVFNKVRYEHYWTDYVSPPLRFIATHPSMLSSGHSFNIYSTTLDQLALDSISLTRLSEGQVLFSNKDSYLQSVIGLDGQSVLVFESNDYENEVAGLYLWVISRALGAVKEVDLVDAADKLGQVLELEIEQVSETSAIEEQIVLEALATKGIYVSPVQLGENREAFLRLSNGIIFHVELSEPFSSLTWPVALLLGLLILGAVGGGLYAMLWFIERRLRGIETVAGRIARGELDARVKKTEGLGAITRLGGAFNSMADHIQRLMFVQKEMIHAVSHELRTPVARIRFGVQMIEDCPSQDALRKQVVGIDGDIQELDELIDEILTYARLEQGGPILAFQDADVRAIVEQVVSEQGSVKPEMEITADFKDGSNKWKESEIETRYIHRAIQNLVGNAVRYANGKVKVACAFDQDTCRVDVEDDGPGIPEDEWESVFTPFARLDDSRTRNTGGYGLGLSIVRRILYWHGGQAFLGRSDMGGAKFTLVWPRKQPVN